MSARSTVRRQHLRAAIKAARSRWLSNMDWYDRIQVTLAENRRRLDGLLNAQKLQKRSR